jgi:soluble lytic murein transglycosylase
VASRDFARAEALTRDARDLDGRVLLFAALTGLNDKARAQELARVLYVEAPAHADAPLWAAALQQPDGSLALDVDEHLARTKALIDARRLDDAIVELDLAGEPASVAERARAHHLRGEALFRMRNRYPDAAKAFEKAAKLGGATEAHDAFHAVRALSRAGQDKQAIPKYRAFARAYPKSSFAADALYLAAWLSAREKLPRAREELARFATSEAAREAPGLRRDALWDLGWEALERGEGKEAERWLAKYADSVDKPLEKGRAAYWRGRAAQLRKSPKDARGHWLDALNADVLGYYAQLAATRLRELGDSPPSPFVAEPRPLPRPVLEAPPGVRFYAQLGLVDDAARLAEPWVKTLDERSAKVAAWLAARNVAKAYVAADPLLPDVLASRPDGPSAWLWEALLPRPYLGAMRSATEPLGLDLDELYAHMQVESRYQPRVVSGADALGLLQLLPGTAFRQAAALGKKIQRNDIFVPSINIELAARVLADLLREHKGQLPVAMAAYNAGSPRVKGWGTARTPLDVWVERIPIEQTRNYVRRVIGAWSRYRAAHTPDDPWGLPLPLQVGRDEG